MQKKQTKTAFWRNQSTSKRDFLISLAEPIRLCTHMTWIEKLQKFWKNCILAQPVDFQERFLNSPRRTDSFEYPHDYDSKIWKKLHFGAPSRLLRAIFEFPEPSRFVRVPT